MTVKRWLCKECAPEKLTIAGLRFKESGEKEKQTKCAFCGQVLSCRCYNIEIGGKK